MELLLSLKELVSPESIVQAGYIVMAIVIFAETGLLVGFFLPGDSLLITAGIFTARGDLDFVLLNVLLIICAISGDAVGYLIGKKLGTDIFEKKDTLLFKKRHLAMTQEFFAKHGGKTIVFARFVPIVRTFAPTLAGVAKMQYWRFAQYNVLGGVFWIVSLTMLGYFLGVLFPGILERIDIVILFVVFLSILPIILKSVQARYFSK